MEAVSKDSGVHHGYQTDIQALIYIINGLTGLWFETFHIIFRAEELKSITNQLKLRGSYENQHVIITANFMSVAM